MHETDPIAEVIARWYRSPLDYVRECIGQDGSTPEKTIEPWQEKVLRALETEPRIAVRSGHGVGKDQPHDTPTPTPQGWRKFGQLKVGDLVFGVNGKPTQVLGVYEQGLRPVYRVTFDDGSSTECGHEHLWAVRGRQERRKNLDGWRVLTTKDILEIGVKRSNGQCEARQWEVPANEPVEYNSRAPIDGYLMGVWLGDGACASPRITSADREVISELSKRGISISVQKSKDRTQNYGVLGGDLKPWVKKFKTSDKCVPSLFMTSRVSDRLDIVRGLMDTDGTCDHRGIATFTNTSKQLCLDLIELVRSLGGKAMLQSAIKAPFYRKDGAKVFGKPAWNVTVSSPFNPFLLPRKAALYRGDRQERYLKRWIDKIEYVGETETRCIKVAAKDSLYLTSDFIPTHNTTLDAWIIHWFGDTRTDAKIPITAPVSSQLEINLWGEVRKWKQQKARHSPIGAWLSDQMNVKTDEVEWTNGNIAIARTARPDKPEALAGFHATHLLFLLDEASGINELVFETAIGSLSTPGAIQVMTGNPTRAQGYFFNAFHRNRMNWWTARVASEEVPRARGHIEDVVNTYGKESNEYRVRVLGEFPINSNDQLISVEAIERCMARWKQIKPIRVRPIWGADVGYRVDRSTLAKRRGNAMMEAPKFWSGFDPMQFVGALKQEWDLTKQVDKPSSINVDVIGLGAGVVSRLIELGLPAIGINVGESAMDPVKFARKRDELWWLSREWTNAMDSVIPDEDTNVMRQLIAELTAPLLMPPSSNGKIQIEKKDVTKKRIHVSTDLADGWNLTFATYSVPEGQVSAFSVGQARIDFNPLDF